MGAEVTTGPWAGWTVVGWDGDLLVMSRPGQNPEEAASIAAKVKGWEAYRPWSDDSVYLASGRETGEAGRRAAEAALREIGVPVGEPERDPHDDSPTGIDRAPDRYMRRGRETIDRQRDLAYEVAGVLVEESGNDLDSLADALFAYHCRAQVMKYKDRDGSKGPHDAEKAAFYKAMSEHVLSGSPDPRSGRPGFTPYQRPQVKP